MPKRKSGKSAIGLDWGVETYATVAHLDGSFEEIKNPRFLKNSLKELRVGQRAFSKKKRGSKNRIRAGKKVRKLHQKVSNQRKDFAHKVSAKLIEKSGLVATEELQVKNIIAFGGKYKKGLNREILDTIPSTLFSFLKYKAEEADIEWKEIPTRKVKPSQTCSCCGRQEKKALSERIHLCVECGLRIGRDENSARVMLNWALTGNASGWGSSCWGEGTLVSSVNQETHAIATPVAWRE